MAKEGCHSLRDAGVFFLARLSSATTQPQATSYDVTLPANPYLTARDSRVVLYARRRVCEYLTRVLGLANARGIFRLIPVCILIPLHTLFNQWTPVVEKNPPCALCKVESCCDLIQTFLKISENRVTFTGSSFSVVASLCTPKVLEGYFGSAFHTNNKMLYPLAN